ncbi:MAG: hypothetical protein HQ502_20130 [Alphaproteobacteria bacterium]|nr:hypothetical protein [Alphaproteobacteria bacterium]
MLFSARLDETGTDGKSAYVVVAGGVANIGQWDDIEARWQKRLAQRNVSAFHTKEFQDRSGDFTDWGDLKARNFEQSLSKMLQKRLSFEVAVAVERKTHSDIKKEMHGIKGFKTDSDYGLCFRIARFLVCQILAKNVPDARVHFMVESGPFAADAGVIHEDIRKTQGAKYRPAMFSEMLAGFAHVPKGECLGLEAADFLAGRSLADLNEGTFISRKRNNRVSMLADREFLLQWHQDMLKEKDKRRSFGRRAALAAPSGDNPPK